MLTLLQWVMWSAWKIYRFVSWFYAPVQRVLVLMTPDAELRQDSGVTNHPRGGHGRDNEC